MADRTHASDFHVCRTACRQLKCACQDRVMLSEIMKPRLCAHVVNGSECRQYQHEEKWAERQKKEKKWSCLTWWGQLLSCRHSVSVYFVWSRSSRQRCMYAWSGQWRVSDQEDRTEVAQRRQQKTSWRQNESESKRRQVQSRDTKENIYRHLNSGIWQSQSISQWAKTQTIKEWCQKCHREIEVCGREYGGLIVSSAEDRSRRIKTDTSPPSRASRTSLVVLSRAVSGLWQGR